MKCQIITELIKKDIPLLLSKASLKKAGACLDLKNDKALKFGQEIQLQLTSSGHYCVDIKSAKDFERKPYLLSSHEVLMINDEMNPSEKKKKLVKLHKQFGHSSFERLKNLLKNAGVVNSNTFELLHEVCSSCEICLKYKIPDQKPIVGFPLAAGFNETVAMDLHELGHNVWYLHLIDEFTWLSAASIIRSKDPSIIIKNLINHWIRIYGLPEKLYSNNGGEFNNSELQDMAENLNITVKTTPADSPFSNGLLERHNAVLTETLLKVRDEYKLDWETSLGWAINAKNSLQSVHGFSPFQLVFGRNPNLPNILEDNPSALEVTTSSEIVRKQITALHAARKAFIESESSECIRRALRKNIRTSGVNFKNGDKVFYQRSISKEWKGLGTVFGQDGAVVFVLHGGTYVRVHRCRLRKVDNSNGMSQETIHEDERDCVVPEYKSYDANQDTDEEDNASVNSTVLTETVNNPNNQQPSLLESDAEERNLEASGQLTSSSASQPTGASRKLTSKLVLKPGQNVQFYMPDSEEHSLHQATIVSRAGKSTGKYCNWFNIQFALPESKSSQATALDLGNVLELTVVEGSNSPSEMHSGLLMMKYKRLC